MRASPWRPCPAPIRLWPARPGRPSQKMPFIAPIYARPRDARAAAHRPAPRRERRVLCMTRGIRSGLVSGHDVCGMCEVAKVAVGNVRETVVAPRSAPRILHDEEAVDGIDVVSVLGVEELAESGRERGRVHVADDLHAVTAEQVAQPTA